MMPPLTHDSVFANLKSLGYPDLPKISADDVCAGTMWRRRIIDWLIRQFPAEVYFDPRGPIPGNPRSQRPEAEFPGGSAAWTAELTCYCAMLGCCTPDRSDLVDGSGPREENIRLMQDLSALCVVAADVHALHDNPGLPEVHATDMHLLAHVASQPASSLFATQLELFTPDILRKVAQLQTQAPSKCICPQMPDLERQFDTMSQKVAMLRSQLALEQAHAEESQFVLPTTGDIESYVARIEELSLRLAEHLRVAQERMRAFNNAYVTDMEPWAEHATEPVLIGLGAASERLLEQHRRFMNLCRAIHGANKAVVELSMPMPDAQKPLEYSYERMQRMMDDARVLQTALERMQHQSPTRS